MMKTMRNLEARADAAKVQLEHEVAALYEQFHKCEDPEKRVEIKKRLDEMIASVEKKKGDTALRVKKDEKN